MSKVRYIGGYPYYRGEFVCSNLKRLCFFSFFDSTQIKLYLELSRTNQLDKYLFKDRYYLWFEREYPVHSIWGRKDNLAVCKECWSDFLMYRLAREGV